MSAARHRHRLRARKSWRCDNGITIVAENGARFELKDANRDGHIDSVELSSKALLIEVPKKPGGNPFKVLTPQAIAAVRGTKWAVDVAEAKTAVFVADGRVGVSRRARGRGVVLGPGQGVDVEATGPLTVKTWGQPRVDALMARLGQCKAGWPPIRPGASDARATKKIAVRRND